MFIFMIFLVKDFKKNKQHKTAKNADPKLFFRIPKKMYK